MKTSHSRARSSSEWDSSSRLKALIARNSKNRDVLFPYLNGEDLNSRPDQSPSRWVINFRNWPLRRGALGRWQGADDDERVEWLRAGIVPVDYPDPVAADYPDCLVILEQKVKPEREKLSEGDATAKDRARRWWQFARPTIKLYKAIAGMGRVLVRSRVGEMHAVAFVTAKIVLNERLAVFTTEQHSQFSVMQSMIHETWARQYASTLRRDMMYAPSDCFETFPFPERNLIDLCTIGERYDERRSLMMCRRRDGLTTTYNRFHEATEVDDDIAALRALHVEMDCAVVNAYEWTDFDLGHGFHETKRGVRFTISEKARREVLGRLLALNHERYAEEVRRGLHDPKRRRQSGYDDDDDV